MRELHGWRDARGRRLATAARVIAAGSLALALSTPQAARAGADDERALASPDDAARSAVWVFFTGKGAGAPGLSSALERRADELPERTRARRALRRRAAPARVAGRALPVDVRDLPVDPARVAGVLATGARERVRSRWLNAVSVDVTPAQREAVAALPGVERVEPVRQAWRQRPLVTRELPRADDDALFGMSFAQLDLMGAVYLQLCGLTGDGVLLGVQDSGFVLDHVAFEQLEVVASHDFVGGDDDVGEEPGDPEGQYSHGTLVLSTAAGAVPGVFMGAAPGVRVILSKTEDVSQEVPAEEDYFVAGIEWIEEQGADIFTASLGYFDWYTPGDFDGQTAVTTQAVNVAAENGLIVFVAMGNAGSEPTTLGAPADSAGAISIGALLPNGQVAEFSSRGPTTDGRIKPDVSARGVDVKIAAPGTVDEYGAANGTSLATPLAAGLAALLLEAKPDLTPETMGALLRATATQAETPDNDVGWGLIDGRAAVGDYCTCADVDGDGHLDTLCGGDDCDDARASVHPGAEELCDGLDNDCDDALGEDEVDADGDGVLLCAGDCDDDNALVAPGKPELCGDGLDNDCEGGDATCPPPETSSSASDGEADTGVDFGSEGDSEAGTESAGGSGGDDNGCACGQGSRDGPGGAALLVLAALGLTRRRR